MLEVANQGPRDASNSQRWPGRMAYEERSVRQNSFAGATLQNMEIGARAEAVRARERDVVQQL